MTILKRGNPITAERLAKKRPYPVQNQALTSSGAMKIVRVDDNPAQDSQLRVPAPSNPEWTVDEEFSEDGRRFGAKGKPVGVAKTGTTNYAASGDRKPKGYNVINDGGYTPGGKRTVGNGNQPSAQGRQWKTNADIFTPGMRDRERYGL